jgi:hypothetical protein
MAVTEEIPGSLNEQQVIMLRLLKNPLPDDDFRQMRNLAVKLLASKLDLVIEEWENKTQISEDTYDKLSKGHFRSKGK